MKYTLSLSPSGHLHLSPYVEEKWCDSPIINQQAIAAFTTGPSEGLLSLLATHPRELQHPTLIYWRDFIGNYVNALCQKSPLSSTTRWELPPVLPSDTLEQWVLRLPPMLGAEYCSVDTLTQIWLAFDVWLQAEIQRLDKGLVGFLQHHLPQWQQSGRVCFHLAENKNDPHYPFAFLATYAPYTDKNIKIQYQPLSKALTEFAGEGNKPALLHLLHPVYEASKDCQWLETLISFGDLYHPLAWTPQEAYRLLKDVPLLEKSGITVRLPNWWKKRPRPRVQINIGHNQQKNFGADALLDFSIDVALEGEPLTQEELTSLLATPEGIVSLRGQWVEIDNEKLQQTLTHWQSIQTKVTTEDGISFIEGMRLLAGAQHDLSDSAELANQEQSWAFVAAGPALNKILMGLRQPDSLAKKKPGTLLKATLRPYQQIGLNWLYFLTEMGLGACLADDMGLGKTIQVIALLLMKKKRSSKTKAPSLLVLPASLLANWQHELQQFAPSLQPLYLHTSQIPRSEIEAIAAHPQEILESTDLVLTTYGTLLRQPWLQQQRWDLVILDEAQAIKNPQARQTKIVKTLQGQARIALTGTPVENRLGDLWSLFDFLCPGLLGSTTRFKQFIKSLEEQEQHSFAPLRRLVQPYILRRLKTDKHIINDLPDKTETIAWCGLTKQQTKLYVNSVEELSNALHNEDGIKRRGLVLAYLMRFKQICNHPSQLLGDADYNETHSGKFARLRQIAQDIAERQEKVLVFTQFREMTEPLVQFLTQVFAEPGLVLHGSTPIKQRQQLVARFQDEQGPPFFVLSLKAAGTGLNLTAASHVIHFDRWWNPAVENQATDRAFRIGQRKNVLVHKFVCRGTIEEKVHQMIVDKMQLADNIIEANDKETVKLTELDDKALIDLVSLDINQSQF